MDQNLSAYDKAIFRYCSEVLHYLWDPIGVAGHPQARDEYDAYVPRIVSLLSADATASAIAGDLTQIATERMGLNARPEKDRETAERLIEWRDLLLDRGR